MKLERKPKVVFTPLAWRKMFSYARAVRTEITGFSDVQVRDNTFYVSDTYIFPQVATGGHVELDSGALLSWMEECKRNGRPELPGSCRLWWHSHVNFSCFRSGTDEATVERLLTAMPYVICCVVNQSYQYELSLHLKDPYRITFNHMNPYVEKLDTGKLDLMCDKEAAKLVKPKVHKTEVKVEPVNRYPLIKPKEAVLMKPTKPPGYTDEEWSYLCARFPELRDDPYLIETLEQ